MSKSAARRKGTQTQLLVARMPLDPCEGLGRGFAAHKRAAHWSCLLLLTEALVSDKSAQATRRERCDVASPHDEGARVGVLEMRDGLRFHADMTL